MPRFVILYHEMPDDAERATHWDLLLESETALRTWALPSCPDTHSQQVALALPDHRVEYLTYEGPISGNRGKVLRWDAGTYHALATTGDELQLQLAGSRMQGVARLVRLPAETGDANQRWRFEFSPVPDSTATLTRFA